MRLEPDANRHAQRAFRTSPDWAEAASSALAWAKAATGCEDCTIQLVLPDSSNVLRLAAVHGERVEAGRRRSARRRLVYETGEPLRIYLRQPAGDAVAILPLVSRGESFGVIEVIAPRRALEERWEMLAGVAGHVALVVRNLKENEELHRRLDALGREASLTRDLVQAETPKAAIRAALDFCSVRFDFPAVAWAWHEETGRLRIMGVRGLGERRRREVRGALGSLPRWQLLTEPERRKIQSTFAAVVGAAAVSVIDAGSALVLMGGTSTSMHTSLEVVGSLLEDVLLHQSTAARAERRNEQLELGLAWTAHEFRAPLAGAKAAIEVVLSEDAEPSSNRELLTRSQRELQMLTGMVDDLLQWSVAAPTLPRSRVDLVEVVRDAVESCRLEPGGDRVVLLTPPEVMVNAHSRHLRSAIANVIRNALHYSPQESEVTVSIAAVGADAVVRVKDRGPGVPVGERDAIFDPFVRGRSVAAARAGRGLGLYIARRVVEAHDGSIWVESNGQGSTFSLGLPLANCSEPAHAAVALVAGRSRRRPVASRSISADVPGHGRRRASRTAAG